VIADIRAQLPFDDDVVACLTDRLATDQDLLRRTSKGLSTDQPEYAEVLDLGTQCTQAVVFAPQFAQNVQAQSGGTLTADQMACLTQAYRTLTKDDLQQILNAAMSPTATDRAEQGAKTDALITGCGVALPNR